MILAELLDRTGLDVLDHLERETSVPVINGLQAQGDLIVIPYDMITHLEPRSWFQWRPMPPEGIELVRGIAGNNPHTLVADRDMCHWSDGVLDRTGLAIGVFENTTPAYLIHPEHGGTGVAPGKWLVRRQQERGAGFRPRPVLIAD